MDANIDGQFELPIGDPVVRLVTAVEAACQDVRDDFERECRVVLDGCPSMTAFVVLAVDRTGNVIHAERAHDAVVPFSRLLLPELARNALFADITQTHRFYEASDDGEGGEGDE